VLLDQIAFMPCFFCSKLQLLGYRNEGICVHCGQLDRRLAGVHRVGDVEDIELHGWQAIIHPLKEAAIGIRATVPRKIQKRGWGAVLCYLQRSVHLHFCCCITRHCLQQSAIALQCPVVLFPISSAQSSFYNVMTVRRLRRLRMLQLLCFSGIFRLFVVRLLPGDVALGILPRANALLRRFLLRFVCSASAASLICNSGMDR
jgi:hypothetical protein